MEGINDILKAIKVKISEIENEMEGAESDDFLFCEGKTSMLHDLSRELRMIMFNKGRTLDEYLPVLRARQDAIYIVIDLIKKRIE